MNKSLQFYQDIAVQSRKNVKKKFADSPMQKNIHFRKRYGTLKGFCAEVSEEVVKLLAQNGVFASKRSAISLKYGGGNHIVVYVPQDNVIIDGTINQYIPNNHKYVYKVEDYPARLR